MAIHEMAAAWLVAGAIILAVGEFKAHVKARGANGWGLLGLLIMILAAANGL